MELIQLIGLAVSVYYVLLSVFFILSESQSYKTLFMASPFSVAGKKKKTTKNK